MGIIVAVTGMPLSLLFTPDAYYFGVCQLLVKQRLHMVYFLRIGSAAIFGQMTTGFPLSPLQHQLFY